MTVQGFIIHLQRAERRGEHARSLIDNLPVPTEILDAVDGEAMSEPEIAGVFRRSLHRPWYPFALRKSEIACFLSHRKAWQEIVDRNLSAGLIVEDDVEPGEGFDALFRLAASSIQPNDYIRFPRWERGENGDVVAAENGLSIIEPRLPGLGMQMQLVGVEAARALLAATRRFDRPVDTTIQMGWLHTARILSARPIAIREIDFDLGGSVVQNKKKTLAARLYREVMRPWYRFTLYMINRLQG